MARLPPVARRTCVAPCGWGGEVAPSGSPNVRCALGAASGSPKLRCALCCVDVWPGRRGCRQWLAEVALRLVLLRLVVGVGEAAVSGLPKLRCAW